MGDFVSSPQKQEYVLSNGCYLWNLTQILGLAQVQFNSSAQFLPPCFLLGMATAQPKCIKTGRPQKPHSLPHCHLHHWAMLLNCSYTNRDQDLLRFHVKPTQPADPHRSALPAPCCSPVRAEWPDGIFGLRPQFCLPCTEVRPKYYTLGGGGSIQNLYVWGEWIPKRASLQ